MNYPIKSSRGLDLIPLETQLLGKRYIFIGGEIKDEMAVDFAMEMFVLAMESNEPITLVINSPGGEINAGLAMYDLIVSSPVPIRTVCLGKAYSMAALLFISGTGGRVMLKNSELMLHEPLVESKVSGSFSSIRSISDTLQKTQDFLVELIAKHTGQSEEKVFESISYDHYFNAEESIAFGLCDEVVEFKDLLPKEVVI